MNLLGRHLYPSLVPQWRQWFRDSWRTVEYRIRVSRYPGYRHCLFLRPGLGGEGKKPPLI